MDFHLQNLYEWIIDDIAEKIESYNDEPDADMYPRCSAGLHKFIREVEGLSDITFNFNEEGRLHSKYLGDRYEPAIIVRDPHYGHGPIYYYLFDGEIKDCVHPFSIEISRSKKIITYYSSERIKQELPVNIIENKTNVIEIYNKYGPWLLMLGYKHGIVEINIADYVKQDYTLHDCMELRFKFAD